MWYCYAWSLSQAIDGASRYILWCKALPSNRDPSVIMQEYMVRSVLAVLSIVDEFTLPGIFEEKFVRACVRTSSAINRTRLTPSVAHRVLSEVTRALKIVLSQLPIAIFVQAIQKIQGPHHFSLVRAKYVVSGRVVRLSVSTESSSLRSWTRLGYVSLFLPHGFPAFTSLL